MFGPYFDWHRLLVLIPALLMTGVAVKLMDDFLDEEVDRELGHENLAARLGRATLPYALVLLGLGMALATRVSLAMFLAAYSLGMAGDLSRRLPTGLKGYQESLVTVGLGAMVSGWRTMAAALAVVVWLQAADDLVDRSLDRRARSFNLAEFFGGWEAALGALTLWFISLSLDGELTAAATLVAVALVGWPAWARYRTGPRAERDDPAGRKPA